MLLNTDGSLPSTVDSIAYGGDLIRNSLDLCRVGFMANFGETSVLRAELWVILQGLQLSWDSGFHHLDLECNNAEIVALIFCQHAPLEIKGILERNWCIDVYHVYKETNFCADFLSTLAFNCIK